MNNKIFCGEHLYKEEPNISLSHRLYVIWSKISTLIWFTLDWLHIVRSTYDSRYGLMGDEACYVDHWSQDMETAKIKTFLKKRKWWQYIFVERKLKPKF